MCPDPVPPVEIILLKDWVDWLSALLAPAIALLAVVVAVQQRKINRDRLRFEQFDKKFAIYNSVRRFLALCVISGGVIKEMDGGEYVRGIYGARFLFGPKLHALLVEIHHKSVTLDSLIKELDKLPEGSEERRASIAEQRAIKDWFENTLLGLDDLFDKYLKLYR
jgi:hypothetical protein